MPNRSILFDNLNWPIKEWDEEKTFALETISDFVKRCIDFANKMQKYKKVILVSHSAICIAIAQLIIGKNPDDIKKVCLETRKIISKYSGTVPENEAEQLVYLTGMKPCGLTWIKEVEPIWFSRVVYE